MGNKRRVFSIHSQKTRFDWLKMVLKNVPRTRIFSSNGKKYFPSNFKRKSLSTDEKPIPKLLRLSVLMNNKKWPTGCFLNKQPLKSTRVPHLHSEIWVLGDKKIFQAKNKNMYICKVDRDVS